jgi:hypothetical protein
VANQKYEIEEQHLRLGRNVWHDERSRAFAAEAAPAIIAVDWTPHGLPLNQKNVGSCTAEAVCAALNSRPGWLPGTKIYHQANAYELYRRETADEGEPWPPNDPGGSGLAVCKAAVELGMITSYTHAFGPDEALKALSLRPVITGFNWYSSFDHPDPVTGMVSITPGAFVRGGHEVCGVSIQPDKETVGFWNSWGPKWGRHGRFSMTFATWARLLSEDGDVTVPMP